MSKANRVAIVTGGGTGIGAATARRLAQLGCAVAVVGRRLDKLQETVASIEQAGGQAIAISADMGDPDAPDRIVDEVVRAWGRIDVVVNNAAAIKHRPFDQFTTQDFDLHFSVNVRGPFLLTQKALPYLRKSGDASVVNVSSTSAALDHPRPSVLRDEQGRNRVPDPDPRGRAGSRADPYQLHLAGINGHAHPPRLGGGRSRRRLPAHDERDPDASDGHGRRGRVLDRSLDRSGGQLDHRGDLAG